MPAKLSRDELAKIEVRPSDVKQHLRFQAEASVRHACLYFEVEPPALRYFDSIGAAAGFNGLYFGDQAAEIWLRVEVWGEHGPTGSEISHSALHEAFHHVCRVLTGRTNADATEEADAKYFASHFDQICREEHFLGAGFSGVY